MEAYKAQPDDTADYYGGLNMDKVDELTERWCELEELKES